MKSSIRNKSEGKFCKTRGKIKQEAGKAVWSRDLNAEGKAESIGGK